MTRIGIIGIGFMGMIHYLTYQKLRSAKVVAICEPNRKRLQGDWRDIRGNFGPQGTQMDLDGIFLTPDWQALIARSDLDLIDICLPPALHAPVAIAALKAGRHVFCEKPIALRVPDARRMVRTAEAQQRLLMIGQVLPMFPEYHAALEAARSGQYGPLLGGEFRRVISDPKWLPKYYEPDQIGGPLLDLNIHDAHFIRLMFGTPTHVTTIGRMQGEVPKYFSTQFEFGGQPLTVTATGGVIDQPGRSFLHGYEIHFQRATMLFEFAVIDDQPRALMPCTVIPQRGKARPVRLGSPDPMVAFEQELKAVLRAVRTGEVATFLGGEPALDALRICQKQSQSLQQNKRVAV